VEDLTDFFASSPDILNQVMEELRQSGTDFLPSYPSELEGLVPVEHLTRTHLISILSSILQTKAPRVIGRSVLDFEEAVMKARTARPPELQELDLSIESQWPKDTVEYMFYPDQFGVDGKTGTFETAARMIPYLKELGVDQLYPLPFLRSAGLDGGFDVMDFMNVEPRLGGTEAFEHFLREAKKNAMKVKMDLVLNHVSDQHPWFQALLDGDDRFRECFITREQAPAILRRYESSAGKVVVYRETGEDGTSHEVHRRLIFPEITDCHYREVKLSDGRTLWIYHTFYPFQLDLNYRNPEVLKEAYALLAHWANKGIDVFRLDAIPFLDKSAENHTRTHRVVELLSQYLKHIAPASRLKVEACQKLDDIVRYFGRSARTEVKLPLASKLIETPSESQIAYQFEGMTASWLTLISGNKRYYDEFLSRLETLPLPHNAIWANFLRVHDELTLEMLPDAQKPVLQSIFREGRGASFRDGNGVAGRAAEFLGNDIDRIRLAYSLLMSQDGMPVLYYGDEIAAGNNVTFVQAEARLRAEYFGKFGIAALSTFDTRDLGRGPIPRDAFESAAMHKGPLLASSTFDHLHTMIIVRRSSLALRRGRILRITNDCEDVLSYCREHSLSGETVLVVHHLDDKPATVMLDLTPVPELALKSSIHLGDYLTGKEYILELQNGKATLQLGRFETVWLGNRLRN